MKTADYPTYWLRFISRNGKRILQQQFIPGTDEHGDFSRAEWRDVPYIPHAELGDMTEHP